MATKLQLDFTCQQCDYQVTLLKLLRTKREALNHECPGPVWQTEGHYERSNKDYHIAENIVGLGLAATIGVGFRVSPSSESFSCKIRCANMPRKLVERIVSLPNHDARFQHIQRFIEAQIDDYNARIEELAEQHGVNCFQCQELFLPAQVLLQHDLASQGQFMHNGFCSQSCIDRFASFDRQRQCLNCRKTFLLPTSGPGHTGPREWQVQGYCSSKCLQAKNATFCIVCNKKYELSRVNYLPIHEKIQAVQKQGFCGVKCHAKNPSAVRAPVAQHNAGALPKRKFVKLRCKCSYETKVPFAHQGMFYFCNGCKTSFKMPKLVMKKA